MSSRETKPYCTVISCSTAIPPLAEAHLVTTSSLPSRSRKTRQSVSITQVEVVPEWDNCALFSCPPGGSAFAVKPKSVLVRQAFFDAPIRRMATSNGPSSAWTSCGSVCWALRIGPRALATAALYRACWFKLTKPPSRFGSICHGSQKLSSLSV